MRVMELHTESGSMYTVTELDDGTFTLRAANVPNPHSAALAGEWPIERPVPWPPQLGKRMWLACVHWADKSHPDRMPGGGKVISPVRMTREVT